MPCQGKIPPRISHGNLRDVNTYQIPSKRPLAGHVHPSLNSETHQPMYQPHPGDNIDRNPRTMGRRKPPTYDGNTSWRDYLVQFDLLSDLKNWTEDVKTLELASSLQGQVQSILSDLLPEHRFPHLVEFLTLRFEPDNQNEVYHAQLKTRVRKKDEDLGSLAQDIARLVQEACPSTSLAPHNSSRCQ